MNGDMREFIINKLLTLKIQAEFEDRQRGKVRYVKKVQAYQDLINLINTQWEEDINYDDTGISREP